MYTPGNGAVAALLLQRQRNPPPGTLDPKHPESFPTYEGWLETFGSLPTFTSDDKVPGKEIAPSHGDVSASHDVLGEKASREAADPADKKAPSPIDPKPGDKFIDHPTDKWVKDHLPAELRLTAYRLPANCADVAVVLRHVWLFAHHRSESYKGFAVGVGATAESDEARTKRVRRAIGGITSENVVSMLNPYTDTAGHPLRSIAALGPMLHPGDVLVWAHHEGPPAGPTRARSGGHTQTIVSLERQGRTVTEISTLQGNQPLPKESGTKFRFAPGRRIEQGVLKENRLHDITITSNGSTESVWIWADGHTTLVMAGPPRSSERPEAAKEDGQKRRRLADWLPAIAHADRGSLPGVIEASMREALAMLERGDPLPEVEGEARSLGHAARQRVAALDADLVKKRKPPDPGLHDNIADVLRTLQTGHGSTQAAAAGFLFAAVLAAFKGTTAHAGWSSAGPTTINFGERVLGHVRRIPLEGLPGGAPQAIVAVPSAIVGGKREVGVLLHFHGWGTGFRDGRDVMTDKIEAQLEASRQRMVAILPQGGAKSEFGSFNPDHYAAAVFGQLETLGVWGVLGQPPRGKIVITGHSGGGKAAMDLVTAGAPGLGKGRLSEVALFDGINGPDELGVAQHWVNEQLTSALKLLRSPAVKGNPAKEDAILDAMVRFRAYHSGSATAKPSSTIRDWPGLHASLRAAINAWFADHGAEMSPGGPSKPGGAAGTLLDALNASG